MTRLIASMVASVTMLAVSYGAALAQAGTDLVIELEQGGQLRKVFIRLRPDLAPNHVKRVERLAKENFYNNIPFHRVIPGFMAQSGDPTGTGTGGSNYPDLRAEFTQEPFKLGTVGAARTQNPHSANSQFFICFTGCGHLTGAYTVWGQVVSGMKAVAAIKSGTGQGGVVSNPDRIKRAYLQPAQATYPQ